jgi:hypothetical protein
MATIEQQIKSRLLRLTSNSIIVKSIKDQLAKEAIDYKKLVKQIKDQIRDNSPMMIVQIGADNVVFFKNLKY